MTNKNTETLALLNQTMLHHKQWFNHFIRDMICRSSSLHNECSLNSGIIALENFHKELHEQANKLYHLFNHHEDCKKDYDNLITKLEQFNSEIYALQKELEMSIEMHQPQTMMTPTMITMLPILHEQQTFAKRQLQTCYIALFNIDLLNKIEEEYGVTSKDKVLITIAQLLVEQLRGYDKVFCYSSETFLVSLQNVNAEQALDLIDRLRIKISKKPINIGLSEPLSVTVSCGITALDPTFTMEQLLQQANIALYIAKKSGRNNTKSWGN